MDERFYHLSANYTGEPDSWSNNFLNLEVNFKKELSEMHSDFRTTLIVAQDLDNAFQFINRYYIMTVNISISGPKQKSDLHSNVCFSHFTAGIRTFTQ